MLISGYGVMVDIRLPQRNSWSKSIDAEKRQEDHE